MLDTAMSLKGYKLHSLDGEVGKVEEFFFDDLHWTIRYLVANTGNWLIDRQVLISPYSLIEVNKEEEYITVNLTRKQIESSPAPENDKPVSRQFEEAFNGYYGLPMYWNGPYIWGSFPYIVIDPIMWKEVCETENSCEQHLRSTSAVRGYDIQATDGEIGKVEDFVVDDETWTIRYLVIDTGNWLPGKKVLISPQWIENVSWDLSKVFVTLSRNDIKQSPEYSEEYLITRDYETRLHQHYNRQGYWVVELDKK